MDRYSLKQLQRIASLAGTPYSRLNKSALYQRLLQEELLFEPKTIIRIIDSNEEQVIELVDQIINSSLHRDRLYLISDTNKLYQLNIHSDNLVELSLGGTISLAKQVIRSNSSLYFIGVDSLLYCSEIIKRNNIEVLSEAHLVNWSLTPWGIAPTPLAPPTVEAIDGDDHGIVFQSANILYKIAIDHRIAQEFIGEIQAFKYRYGLLTILQGGVCHMKGVNPLGAIIDQEIGSNESITISIENNEEIVEFDFGLFIRICRDRYGRIYGWGTGVFPGSSSLRTLTKPTRLPLSRKVYKIQCIDDQYILFFDDGGSPASKSSNLGSKDHNININSKIHSFGETLIIVEPKTDDTNR